MESVQIMTPREQGWWLDRLNRQYKIEKAHYDKQAKSQKQGASKLIS